MKTGVELVADIDAARPASGEAALWWMGQASFVVKLGDVVLYVDPFLTAVEGRRVPPLVSPADVGHTAAVLGTHDHIDHIDRGAWPAIAGAAPQAVFVVPDLVREGLVRDLGIAANRFRGMDHLRTVRVAGVAITGVAAAHELLDRDEATGQFPYLGYVIEGNGVTLYHAGDCCIWEGLQAALSRWRFDVMMLPINGRDARRLRAGCIGNMTYQEAADLAGARRPGVVIPCHFDMFGGNLEDPALFTDYVGVKYPSLRTWIPQYGERLVHRSRR